MDYVVKLQDFEGPLDLLLHLIGRAKLDIHDIFVSEITDQYLVSMKGVEELDMDTASEFLSIAATLLLIKSRSLLPRPPQIAEEEEENPELALIRRLEEYKQFKEAGEQLRPYEQEFLGTYFKLPEEFPEPKAQLDFTGVTMEDLYAAFKAILDKKAVPEEPDKPREIPKDTYTISGRMRHIRTMLGHAREILFNELFEKDRNRMEVVVTFMALLELIQKSEVWVRQKEPFGDILLGQTARRNAS